MVESTGMKCVKYLMIIFNFLFLIAGLALIIVGAVAQAETSKLHSANAAAIFVIVVGCVIFVLAFFGCCGAYKENRCLLMTFGICMVIMLIVCIAAVIVSFVFRGKAETLLAKMLDETIEDYNPGEKNLGFWHELQLNHNCCGVYNYTDWNRDKHLSNDSYPASCCSIDDASKTCSRKDIVAPSKGCLEVLLPTFQNISLGAGIIVASIAILQILAILFAFCLANAIHKDYSVV
jgi:CD63 antigen